MKENVMTDEIVQYFVVNKELSMSPGKIAAQVAHVATNIVHSFIWDETFELAKASGRLDDPNFSQTFLRHRLFSEWFNNNQPKIILRAKERELLRLIEQGWYFIRDNGRTEIPENSLTVVGCVPNYKSELLNVVKRYQLL